MNRVTVHLVRSHFVVYVYRLTRNITLFNTIRLVYIASFHVPTTHTPFHNLFFVLAYPSSSSLTLVLVLVKTKHLSLHSFPLCIIPLIHVMDKSYNLFSLASILSDRTTTLQWLRDVGLIPHSKYCNRHQKEMTLCESRSLGGEFRCRKKHLYDHSISVASNTWLERCHTSPSVCILLTYCFSAGFSYNQTIRECSIDNRTISPETISDRFSFCREVCVIALDTEYTQKGLIGGPGAIIEIDECKVGRRKYSRGRVVEGNWILGMIHRGHPSDYRLEICPSNKRDNITLLTLIKKHVAPGSVIHTDCWKGYYNLKQHGYKHFTVNHSTNFVDSATGAHTQNIESSWRSMRRNLSRGGVHQDNIADHLCEYLWRRRIRLLNVDPFLQLLTDIKRCYPGT